MSWIQLFAILAVADPAQAGDPIILREPPRPLSYRIGLQVVCGARAYDVTFETVGYRRSKVVRATANGADVMFYSASGDLASVVEGFAIMGLTPSECIEATGDIKFHLLGYDPAQDAKPGHNGEVVHTFSSVTAPAGQ